MKTSLEHLPEPKQAQLRAITTIFCEGVPVDMFILFGSHARGDWVEDPDTQYFSDYDLLVVVDNEKLAHDLSLWNSLEGQARQIAGQTPVTLIVHDLKFLNHEIRIGQYFFSDIVNEGVLLYDSRKFQLAKPKALNAQERLALAERNFANWFDSASEFWRGCRYFASRNLLKHAAFLLHQATERYYHAAILVFTGYKQRTHDIDKLGALSGAQHPLLADVFPRTEPADADLFDLLKKAYIEARYSASYRITMEELSTLQQRVLILAERVRAACLEQMRTFCGPDAIRQDLPLPPQSNEAVLSNLPPPPTDPADFARWAQGLVEVSEQHAEVREAKGLVAGEVRRAAADILLVLRARRIEVSAELERRIVSCTDPAVLARWLERAATVSSAGDVIAA